MIEEDSSSGDEVEERANGILDKVGYIILALCVFLLIVIIIIMLSYLLKKYPR